jgi:glycosyltransferase involved in cell wall biosynthesis
VRTLMISSKRGLEGDGWAPPENLRELIDTDRSPDVLALHDALGITVLDARLVRARLPFRVEQALAIVRERSGVDAVLTWGERDAIRTGALMCVLRPRPVHVSILFWVSGWKKAVPLRAVHAGIDRLVIPSPRQYEYARERMRLPARKLVQVPWPVDTRFWRPLPGDDRPCICAVGSEMRDWETFAEALRPLGIPCHIAAGNPRREGAQIEGVALPADVTVGYRAMPELRDLYARSRFVVVPLLPTDSDQGITTCLEAMAMGRAVICTDTYGQVGALEDGVNSILVPPRDPAALREAIERLWSDPDLCARLGAAGRALVEERYGLDRVIPQLVAVVEDAQRERSA